MLFLKQSESATVKLGPIVDSDGYTVETGLTIAQADVRLSKNGGDIAQKSATAACAHDENGVYNCVLTSTDIDTLGGLDLYVIATSCVPIHHEYMIIPPNEYDSFISGTDNLEVDTIQIGGSTASDQINAEVDNAFNTATPSSPTAHSINERINAIDDKLPSASYLSGTADSDGGLCAADKADINAEALDVLATDVQAELASIPAASTSIIDMILLLYALARNKITQTATTLTLRNDDDDGNIGTATVSDDGTTATRGELT